MNGESIASDHVARAQPPRRAAFRTIRTVTTRWRDNDAYGHVNNVVFYEWFDTVVNAVLIEGGAIDPSDGAVIGLVVETTCQYFSSLAYPQPIDVGLVAEHIGRTSVTYRLAAFASESEVAAAAARFVHVYVDRTSRRPVTLPAALLAVVTALQVGDRLE